MKTPYDSVRRLRRRELDQDRKEITEIEMNRDAVVREINDLEQRHRQELEDAKSLPLIDSTLALARFRQLKAEKHQQVDALQKQIDERREILAERFSDLKAMDIAAENFIQKAKEKQARAERDFMDVVAARTGGSADRRSAD